VIKYLKEILSFDNCYGKFVFSLFLIIFEFQNCFLIPHKSFLGMRKSLLVLLLISLSFTSFAKEITLSLIGQKLSVLHAGYYIEDVILSQREDSCLGYIHPYGPNHCVPIFFERNLLTEVKEFLMNSMPKQANLQPLIIRVNRIFLYQTSQGVRDYSCFDLSLSFIHPGDKGLTEDFSSAVSVSVVQDFFPKNLVKMLVNGFDSSMSQYNKRSALGLLMPTVITPEQLKEDPTYKPGYYKFLSGKKSGKGLYRTWFDFRDNLPDTTLDFKIFHDYNKNQPKLSKAYLKFPEGSKPEKYWGFYEGDSVYFNGGRSYSLLRPEGDLMINYGRSPEYAREVASAAVWGGIMFGIIGASVFGGLTATSSDYNMIDKYKLDPFNGKLLPYDAKDYTLISSNVIFFLSKVSDPNVSLSVYVDGQLQCTMKPGDYFTLDLSCHHTSADIKLVSSSRGEIVKQIPLRLFKSSLYLLKVKKNHSVVINLLYDQMKTDIMKGKTKENTICRVEVFGE
jgi:hypothetical protein